MPPRPEPPRSGPSKLGTQCCSGVPAAPSRLALWGRHLHQQRLDYHAGDGEEQLLDNHPDTLIDLRGTHQPIQLAGACRKPELW